MGLIGNLGFAVRQNSGAFAIARQVAKAGNLLE
jgi:hypothetical protein